MRIALAPVALMLLACVVFLSGCTSTAGAPPEKVAYASAQDSFIAATSTLWLSYQAGEIDEDTWQGEIVPLLITGDRLLDAIRTAMYHSEDVSMFQMELRQVLAALVPFVERVKGDS
jgi:hypothetical protein